MPPANSVAAPMREGRGDRRRHVGDGLEQDLGEPDRATFEGLIARVGRGRGHRASLSTGVRRAVSPPPIGHASDASYAPQIRLEGASRGPGRVHAFRSVADAIAACSTSETASRRYTRPRWTCTSSGRSPRPPSARRSTASSGRRNRAGSAACGGPGIEGHAARGGHAIRARRSQLLPALHAVQDRIGWISQPALNYISRRLAVPPAEAYGVATFYALYSTKPRPPVVAHVCDDIACRIAGAERICDDLARAVGPAGEAARDGRVGWLRSPCLGLCDLAPAAMITSAGDPATRHHRRAGRCGRDRQAPGRDDRHAPADRRRGRPATASLRLLRRIGVVDPARSTTTGPTAATPRSRRPSRSAPRPSSPRSPPRS